MSKIHEKFAATAFKTETAMTFDELLTAADEAATRAAGVITKVVREGTDAHQGRIRYQVKRAGVAKVGNFTVTYTPAEDKARNTIAFLPGDYITSQARIMLIPIGPKDSAALKSFQTFSKLLKQSVV